MSAVNVALIGLGKIARAQHAPAIASNATLRLAATADPHGDALDGVAHFDSAEALLSSGLAIDAVAVCTPPRSRFAIAEAAIKRGLHVLLEKPPAQTVAELEALKRMADAKGVTLFAAWHSRFAAGVAPARAWLSERAVRRVDIVWRENVRQWHPGQSWIWKKEGFGVFDAGINALSILTELVPGPLAVTAADLFTPQNQEAPIAALVTMQCGQGTPLTADFDWREQGEPVWTIRIDTDRGVLKLAEGGARLDAEGAEEGRGGDEYSRLYEHFHDLIGSRRCDADGAPLELMAACFACGRTTTVEPFEA